MWRLSEAGVRKVGKVRMSESPEERKKSVNRKKDKKKKDE
jgi:hypothetical protein